MAGPRRIIAAILVFLSCGLFFFLPQHNGSVLPDFSLRNVTKANSIFDGQMQELWRALAAALEAARPQTYPIYCPEGRPDWEFMILDALKDNQQPPERLNLTDESETELFRSHYRMRLSAKRLGPQLPYKEGTTGIVMTANPKYMPILLVSLKLLRHTGCSLPVEVFLADWSEYDAETCETILPSLNAHCIIISEIYSIVDDITPLERYQFKLFAFLYSSYQHVLFLDTDNYPVYDPTPLFDKPPYTTHGLVTWPDLWANTASSHFYHIAGVPQVPVQTRPSSESGQVMLDKSKHKDSLLMMIYYNFYGPDYYYPLMSQNANGRGDKETYLQAAMVMNLPFYQVRSGPGRMGNYGRKDGKKDGNREHRISGLGQVDPSEDFDYAQPMENHIHKDRAWKEEDLTKSYQAKDSTRSHQDLQETPFKSPRPFFVHQGMFKADPATILGEKNANVRTEDGKWQRMWGDEEDLVKTWGHDIERKFWGVVAEEGCKKDPAHKTCTTLREYFLNVFGSEPPDVSRKWGFGWKKQAG